MIPSAITCVRSGAVLNALLCGTCPELSVSAWHHCERLVVAIGASCGGLSRADVADMLGLDASTVRETEERALAKVRRRLTSSLKETT